eukprot:406206-Rhodomonas_salina.1
MLPWPCLAGPAGSAAGPLMPSGARLPRRGWQRLRRRSVPTLALRPRERGPPAASRLPKGSQS